MNDGTTTFAITGTSNGNTATGQATEATTGLVMDFTATQTAAQLEMTSFNAGRIGNTAD